MSAYCRVCGGEDLACKDCLEAERDEAREVARALYRWYGAAKDWNAAADLKEWPWLKETPAAGDTAGVKEH